MVSALTQSHGATGQKEIAEALGGSLKENSLVVIEGESQTGKSVLCQYMAYNIVHTRGRAVAYYSIDHTVDSLNTQMASMSMDITYELKWNRFIVKELNSPMDHAEAVKALRGLIQKITDLPPWFRFIVIDSPSPYFLTLKTVMQMDFMQSFKELCVNYRSIIMVLNTETMNTQSLARTHLMSDYYLKLRTENRVVSSGQVDHKVVKSMEVSKLNGAEQMGTRPIRFEIKPGCGIQVLPFYHVKV